MAKGGGGRAQTRLKTVSRQAPTLGVRDLMVRDHHHSRQKEGAAAAHSRHIDLDQHRAPEGLDKIRKMVLFYK